MGVFRGWDPARFVVYGLVVVDESFGGLGGGEIRGVCGFT